MALIRLTEAENQFLIDRRIAAEGYPASEAAYVSVVEYIKVLEEELTAIKDWYMESECV
jgi:hypothetical protein